ncbi:Transducin (beta)-like 3 [Mortierella sp. NVP41]|nr:Transducin (beta)-like 3 [Mortierella sp. NVP41]
MAYSPDGGRIVIAGVKRNTDQWRTSIIGLWSTQDNTLELSFKGHGGVVKCLAFSPDGRQCVSGNGSGDGTIRAWDASTGEVKLVLMGHNQPVSAVAYSPDGALIVSGGEGQKLRLWNSHTGNPKVVKGNNSDIFGVAFSCNNWQFATATRRGTISLWDARTGEPGLVLGSPTSQVIQVEFSPNGKLLVSGCVDRTARLWDVASGCCLAVVGEFFGSVRSVAWNPLSFKNGRNDGFFVTGSYDRTVKVWKVVERDGKYSVQLHKSSAYSRFSMSDASIQGVAGLSGINTRLLKQRGAIGEPAI